LASATIVAATSFRNGRREVRRVGVQHLGDAGDRRRGLRGRPGVSARHQDVDVAADLLRSGYGIEGRRLERRVVMIGKNQDGHGVSGCSQEL
jgi:hypothetical protein